MWKVVKTLFWVIAAAAPGGLGAAPELGKETSSATLTEGRYIYIYILGVVII